MRKYEKKRLYDPNLVEKMQEQQYTLTVNGVEVLCKLPPEGIRAHLDPRLKEVIAYKKKMFSERSATGWCLSNERYRPDKVTYDLTTAPVTCEERLISVKGDHKIDVYVFRAESARPGCPVLVYLHGGGFTAGDIGLFGCQMKYIAEQSGALVVFPEYRLAPECPYPGPVEDAWATVEWACSHAAEYGADPEKLMVAGDSAGGSLCNACALLDEAGRIRKLVEIYPAWDMSDYRNQTDYSWSYDCYEIAEEERELAYSRIDRIKKGAEHNDCPEEHLYLQGRTGFRDPLVSAIFAEDGQLARFPETVIVSAEYDYLRVGSDYAAGRLKQLGVPVRSIRYCGCDHGFLDMIGTIVQSEELCRTVAQELKLL